MQKTERLKRGPKCYKISTVEVEEPLLIPLSSGVPLYTFSTAEIGAIKFEIIFEAGRFYEDKKMVAQSCGALLIEGCEFFSSAEISEAVDFEGAYLSSQGNSDFITLNLTCAKRSIHKMLLLLENILANPSFSQEELDIFINRIKQKMTINLSKNDVIAYRSITASLYGVNNVYGYNSSNEIISALTTKDLSEHYKKYCTRQSACFFLSGDFDEKIIKDIEKLSYKLNATPRIQKKYLATTTLREEIFLEGRENQSSLKLALPLFTRKDKNYSGLYFLNTILGGYFGSRLMRNIREQKGYTYNIYSMMDIYKHDGAWIISCELDDKYICSTLEQIKIEFERLQNNLISDQEIQMVKNYLLGNFISTISGPFNAINPTKTEVIMNLKSSFYNQLGQDVLSIEPKDVQSLAKEYLNIDKFWKVIVGKT